jgi:hypothetical protein
VISGSAFKGCSSLRSFRIPASVSHLSVSCFANCSALATIFVEFGSPLPRDFVPYTGNPLHPSGRRVRTNVIFESGKILPDATDGGTRFHAVVDDDFLEGWNHCYPA